MAAIMFSLDFLSQLATIDSLTEISVVLHVMQ